VDETRRASLERLLDGYAAAGDVETADVARLRAALAGDAWSRASALHVTGSALVVHPATRTVLLRWHPRMQPWLQVGGHYQIASRTSDLVLDEYTVNRVGATVQLTFP